MSSISKTMPASAVALATAVDAKTRAANQTGAPAKPQPAARTTVTLSSAALAALASEKEANETPAQTAQEARGNDQQAQRLLARQNAQKAALR